MRQKLRLVKRPFRSRSKQCAVNTYPLIDLYFFLQMGKVALYCMYLLDSLWSWLCIYCFNRIMFWITIWSCTRRVESFNMFMDGDSCSFLDSIDVVRVTQRFLVSLHKILSKFRGRGTFCWNSDGCQTGGSRGQKSQKIAAVLNGCRVSKVFFGLAKGSKRAQKEIWIKK